MTYDQERAVDLSNRIQEVMRTLPPGTQPATVLTALCAVVARCISTLRPEDREPAFRWVVSLIEDHADIRPPN